MNCFLCQIKIYNLKLKKIVNIYMYRIVYKSVKKYNIPTAYAATFYLLHDFSSSHYLHIWQQVNKDEFDFLFNKSILQLGCNYPTFFF